MAVINLTESRIRDLEPGSGIWRDEQVKGLMVVCHATTKTYAVQGDVRRNGRHNPVSALRIPNPKRREVEGLDLSAWWRASESLSPIRRDLHRAMLLTGARRSSILQVRRADVDLEKSILTFNHMKTGGRMLFPMGTWLAGMIRDRLAEDEPLNNPWLWPSPLSSCGHVTEPREDGPDLPSPHEYRHHARTLFIASGVPYAESALLLGQRLPGASGGYVHAEHLVEHLRPHAQALENKVLAGRHPTLAVVEPEDARDAA